MKTLSIETLDALIDASEAELCRLRRDMFELVALVRGGRTEEQPTLDRWARQAEQIRAALHEARAYRDAVRRMSA